MKVSELLVFWLFVLKKRRPLLQKNLLKRISAVYLLQTEKGWVAQEAIRKWIDLTMPPGLWENQQSLFIRYSASTHRVKTMKTSLSDQRIYQVMIPAGMTVYLQTLDIGIATTFKDYLREWINDYTQNLMETNQRGNFKPTIEEVGTWSNKSWDTIADDFVTKAVAVGYLNTGA